MPPKKKVEEKKSDKKVDELADFEPDNIVESDKNATKSSEKGHVAIHSSGFRDFLLKPELLRAVVDAGFEHPSEGIIF